MSHLRAVPKVITANDGSHCASSILVPRALCWFSGLSGFNCSCNEGCDFFFPFFQALKLAADAAAWE